MTKGLNIISELKERGKQAYNNEKYYEAEELFKTALAMNKSSDSYILGELSILLANTYYKLNDIDKYIKYYELSLEHFPKGQASIFSRLAHAYYYIDSNKSIMYHNKGLNIRVNNYDAVSKIFTMLKSSNYTQEEIFNEAEDEMEKLRNSSSFCGIEHFTFENRKNKKNKLNIGYLSSDCHSHIMMNYILPIWENHNQSKFNITIYNTSDKNDIVTEKINNLGHTIIKCSSLDNSSLAQMIYDDEIDILVDLCGFTHLKSTIHYYKPAPIIISYLGFLNTMGIKEVDYILATKYTIPENTAKYYAETPLYLDNNYTVFSPPNNLPEITDCPFEKNGYITFGSFNCTSKFSYTTLYLWAKILEEVPNSKLYIYRSQMTKNIRKYLRNKFKELGVNRERIIFGTQTYTPHYLAYSQSDIALDTYPFSGMSICIENALMGIPTITFAGEGLQSRGAANINKIIGLTDFIAECGDDYIKTASNLANDKSKLKTLRKKLRDTIKSSIICTGAQEFTKEIEEKYKQVWNKFIHS